jgi:hypothetical protein
VPGREAAGACSRGCRPTDGLASAADQPRRGGGVESGPKSTVNPRAARHAGRSPITAAPLAPRSRMARTVDSDPSPLRGCAQRAIGLPGARAHGYMPARAECSLNTRHRLPPCRSGRPGRPCYSSAVGIPYCFASAFSAWRAGFTRPACASARPSRMAATASSRRLKLVTESMPFSRMSHGIPLALNSMRIQCYDSLRIRQSGLTGDFLDQHP